jgi:hypothetical protein
MAMETIPRSPFGNTGEALDVMRSAVRYLAETDYVQLPAETVAEVLRGMEHVSAAQAAVRGKAGWAFTINRSYSEYAQKNMTPWYKNETRVTKAAARAHKAWARRHEEHPVIMAALAEMDVISESWARQVVTWSNKLPEEFRPQCDEILIGAARDGIDEAGLAKIAAELLARLAPPSSDGPEPKPGLTLNITFGGAGKLDGDLSPETAAKVKAVLEPLAAATGPDDTRSYHERLHDALDEAMTRLLAARLVPQSQGAATMAIAHIHFGDLVAMDQDSVLLDRWETDIAAQWAAERAGTHVQPGDGGCWLTGDAARRVACDAMIVPIVTANLDASLLGNLIEACLTLHHASHTGPQDPSAGPQDPSAGAQDMTAGAEGPDLDDLARAILGIVIQIASGAASYLRRNQLGKIGLDGPSLPLDVGDTSYIPPHIRRAVTLRDQGHCAFPGGCDQPAMRSQHHHTEHRAHHGHTAVAKIGLFCKYHHNIVIHTWGWAVIIEPDGTMTARRPDGSVFKRSHPPPPRPG